MLQVKRLRAAAWVLAAVFFLLRFVHLSADYPHWMRWDDGIATDEGWYASAAINHRLWGTWRLPGDMNIPVLMPVWSGLLSVVFRVFGFGIVPARATAAVFFLACCGIALLLLRRFGGQQWLPLYALMLACNPWAFTFSRSAFLEFPMLFFFLAAAWFAGTAMNAEKRGTAPIKAALAGCLFGVAMLTKTTALPLVLPLLYLLAERHRFRIARALPDAVAFLSGLALVTGIAWLLLTRHYAADVHFYLDVVPSGFHFTPRGILADGSRPFRYGLGSDHLLFATALLALAASLFFRKARMLWREPCFAFPAIWFAAFLLFMVEHNNDPARYFAVVIPAVLMIGTALLQHMQAKVLPMYRVLLVLVVMDLTVNAAQVCLFLATPRYTFRNAALAIRAVVDADPSGNRVLLGDNMHEVALQNGLKPMNLLFHSAPIVEQVQRYQPGWWVQFQPQDSGECFRMVLGSGYTVEHMGTWPIFYPGSSLALYKLHHTGQLASVITEQQRRACLPPIEGVSTYR